MLRLLPSLEIDPDDISISRNGVFAAMCGSLREVRAALCMLRCPDLDVGFDIYNAEGVQDDHDLVRGRRFLSRGMARH